MAKPTLLPDPTYLRSELLDASERVITIVVTTTSEDAGNALSVIGVRCGSTRVMYAGSRFALQVGRCDWNCMCDAFLLPNEECSAGFSPNGCQP